MTFCVTLYDMERDQTKEQLTEIVTIRFRPSTLLKAKLLAMAAERDMTEWMRMTIEAKIRELEGPTTKAKSLSRL